MAKNNDKNSNGKGNSKSVAERNAAQAAAKKRKKNERLRRERIRSSRNGKPTAVHPITALPEKPEGVSYGTWGVFCRMHGKRVLAVYADKQEAIHFLADKEVVEKTRTLFWTKDGMGNIDVVARNTGQWRFTVHDGKRVSVHDAYAEKPRHYEVSFGTYPCMLHFKDQDSFDKVPA